MTAPDSDPTPIEDALELIIEHGMDGLGEAIRILLNEAMKIERSHALAARPYERTPERRGHANGFKPKTVDTRLGRIQVDIPQVRGDVDFYPSALEKGIRSKRALTHAIAEMYLQGVSTRKDAEGRESKLLLRNDLPDDIYSAVVRSETLVNGMEQLLGGEVYHYHHKMMLKEPEVGGAWEWHQDYGYWYHNGCLYPLMASCMIAVDRAYKGNGCLQVLRGSHHMGRLDHGQVGTQTGAHMEHVHAAMEQLELVYCEMEPGTGLFFHGNLLHCSAANTSPDPRWTFICCYNAARNNPIRESGHPRYSPLEKWPHARIKEIGQAQLAAL